ncbi:hypothetical protein [Candidatus Protochlamydia phocaeensis]|uniref:hypothetical protein n=1 Tax=Candidatus Protochlamydia phocaeensis TaxID=1414722 RepID=UPI000837C492|nr:hypothetical protein [Candidatus Protochlamydia phocaeensis]
MVEINMTQIGLRSNLECTYQRTGNFAGRLITILQSLRDSIKQSSTTAYASLIIANLIAYEVAKLGARIVHNILATNGTPQRKAVAEGVASALGAGLLTVSIIVFAKAAELPLSPLVVLGVSVATLSIRVLFGQLLKN